MRNVAWHVKMSLNGFIAAPNDSMHGVFGYVPLESSATGNLPKGVVGSTGPVLSGWREQGIQVVDLRTRQVTQTLLQDGAFHGAASSTHGHQFYVSGGNTDAPFVYMWTKKLARASVQ